jgi:tripartite-type tricarboxylate transporter receptor subunit TctC
MAVCLSAWWPAAYGAAGETFPQRPIRWIVPFPPGGSNDVLARYLGIKLSERMKEQVVIDNRAGANGIIGTDLASQATPDGHTILMISTSYILNAAVRKLPYDIVKSFDPVASIGSAPNSIIVYPGFVKSLKELVATAKTKPVNYAATGVGGFNHFGGELFNKVAGIKMQMIAYKGGGPAMIDVIAGQVPVMFSSVTQMLPHARSGKLRPLAVGAAKRTPALPDVPTVIESGFPGYEMAVWWGIAAPAGVPKGPLETLRRELAAVLASEDTRNYLAKEAAEPNAMEPAAIRKMIVEDLKKWKAVAADAKIKVE